MHKRASGASLQIQSFADLEEWFRDVLRGLSRTVSNRGSTCYVIEVCTGCSWNHVCEAFLARTAG